MNLKNLREREVTRKEFLKLGVISIVSIFGIAGIINELISHAATSSSPLEAENGPLVGNAQKVYDTSASGGQAVEFGSASTNGSITIPAISGDSTLVINQALAAAAQQRKTSGAQIVTVLAAPSSLYQVSPYQSFSVLNPSGGSGYHKACIVIPAGVVLDMRGSTLQLQGNSEASLVTNSNLTGQGTRDADMGLRNAILDGRNVNFTSASLMQLAYVDRLSLLNIKIINGSYQGGWVYACTASTFDMLDADNFKGQPWTLGSPLSTGYGQNQIYNSTFGKLGATNIRMINNASQPGNSYDMVLSDCSISSITATNCDAGIKLQWPGKNIQVGTVITNHCGTAYGNSGLKLQGDAIGGPLTGVTVDSITASNQTGPGLYMQDTVDCSVQNYVGSNNAINGNTSDVWIGGTRDHIGTISSTSSGGNGLYIRSNAVSYQVKKIVIVNPGGVVGSVNKAAVNISGGSGTIDSVAATDTRAAHLMTRGIDVNSTLAVGRIGAWTVSGQTQEQVKTVSAQFIL